MLREAAAMVLVRDSTEHNEPDRIEVCMLRRVAQSSFAASAFVFPGGALESGDSEEDWSAYSINDNKKDCLHEEQMIPYKLAAVRETYEEAGIMAATSPVSMELVVAERDLLNKGSITFQSILKKHKLKINLQALVFYDHWITPEGAPIRFDTRFFLSIAQADQKVSHDERETDSSRWTSPAEILTLYEKKEIKLMPVTHVQLMRLARFQSVSDLMSAAQKETVNGPTLPVLIYDEDDKPRSVKISLPEGEVEYPVFSR